MSSHIRAPKARKINSYNISRNPSTITTEVTENSVLRTAEKDCLNYEKLEKRNSIEDIRKTNLMMEYEQVCFDENEYEIKERERRLSMLKEINGIMNQTKHAGFSKTKLNNIERCENPFEKNFRSEEQLNLEKCKSYNISSKSQGINKGKLDSTKLI